MISQKLHKKISEYVERLQRFTDHLEEANDALDGAYIETAKSILELATNAKQLWNSRTPHEKKEFLDKVTSNSVLDGPTLRYSLRKPFAALAEMALKEDWRPQGDC